MFASNVVVVFLVLLACLYVGLVHPATFEEESEAAEIALEDAIIESVKLDFRVKRNDELFITIVTDDGHKLCDGRISGVASLDQISCTFDPELFERPEIFIMTTVYSMSRKEIVSQNPARFKNPSYGMLSEQFKRRLLIRRITQRVVRTAQDKRVWVGALLASGGYGMFVFFYPSSKTAKKPETVSVYSMGNFLSKPPPPPRKGWLFFPTASKSARGKSSSLVLRQSSSPKATGSLLSSSSMVAASPQASPSAARSSSASIWTKSRGKAKSSAWLSYLSASKLKSSSFQLPADLRALAKRIRKDVVLPVRRGLQAGVRHGLHAADSLLYVVGNTTVQSFRLAEGVTRQGAACLGDVYRHAHAYAVSAAMREALWPVLITFAAVLTAISVKGGRSSPAPQSSFLAHTKQRLVNKYQLAKPIATSKASAPQPSPIIASPIRRRARVSSSTASKATSSNPFSMWAQSTKTSASELQQSFQLMPVKHRRRWYLSVGALIAQAVFFAVRQQWNPRIVSSSGAWRHSDVYGHECLVPFRN